MNRRCHCRIKLGKKLTTKNVFATRSPHPSFASLLQFDCTNTLNDQLLEKVTVQMEPSDAYDVICYIPAASLPYNQPGMCYTLVQLPQDDPAAGTN